MASKRPDAVKALFGTAHRMAEAAVDQPAAAHPAPATEPEPDMAPSAAPKGDQVAVIEPVRDADEVAPTPTPAAERPKRAKRAAEPAPEESEVRSRVQSLAARQDVEVHGFRVAPAKQVDEVVQLSVRIPKSLRHAIHAACARYDTTVTDFATLAFQNLLEELRQSSSG